MSTRHRPLSVPSESPAQLTYRRPTVSVRGATRRHSKRRGWNVAGGRNRPAYGAQTDTEGGLALRPCDWQRRKRADGRRRPTQWAQTDTEGGPASDEASRKQAQTDSGRKPLLRAAQPHGQVRDGGLSWPWAGALSEHMDTVGANRHRGRSCLAHGRR